MNRRHENHKNHKNISTYINVNNKNNSTLVVMILITLVICLKTTVIRHGIKTEYYAVDFAVVCKQMHDSSWNKNGKKNIQRPKYTKNMLHTCIVTMRSYN